jgi:hypothetical protein
MVACCFHSSFKWVYCIRKLGAVLESVMYMALLPSVTNIWVACCMSALWHVLKLVHGVLQVEGLKLMLACFKKYKLVVLW